MDVVERVEPIRAFQRTSLASGMRSNILLESMMNENFGRFKKWLHINLNVEVVCFVLFFFDWEFV